MKELSIITDRDPDDAPGDGGAGPADRSDSPARTAALDVFGYEDYRAYMRDRFAELQARRPAFSQRGLARKARIANPGFFNEVIKGRRRLSPAAAAKMAVGLDLSIPETEYFFALVDYMEARDPIAKLRAGRRMMALRNRQLYRTLHSIPSLAGSLRDIVRELERDWVLQAAGLSVDQPVPEDRPPVLGPPNESALQGILEQLVCLRSQADAARDPRVVHFSLRAAPRTGRP